MQGKVLGKALGHRPELGLGLGLGLRWEWGLVSIWEVEIKGKDGSESGAR